MVSPVIPLQKHQQGDRLISPVGKEEHVCECFQFRNPNAQDYETAMANARLISKSPEMFELLKSFIRGVDICDVTEKADALVAEIEDAS